MLITGILYISKISTYYYPNALDRSIYYTFSKMKITVTGILRIYNLLFVLYALISVSTCHIIKKMKLRYILLLSLPILFFAFVNDPFVSKNLMYYSYKNPTLLSKYLSYAEVIKTVCKYIFISYMLLTVFFCVYAFLKSQSKIIKKSIVTTTSCVQILNIFVYTVFVRTYFSPIAPFNVNQAALPTVYPSNINYITISYMLFFILGFIIFIIIKNRPFMIFNFRGIKKKKTKYAINEKLTNIHLYKNTFCVMKQQLELIKIANRSDNRDDVDTLCGNGIKTADEIIEILGKDLKISNTFEIKSEITDLIDILEETISKVKFPENTVIIRNYETGSCKIAADKYNLKEAFFNIISNASDAMKNTLAPKIEIRIALDINIYIIEITDNGHGIEKSSLKKIFKPFYTTKAQKDSYGIGLPFAKQIIKMHNGEVVVSSKPGIYTKFQIILPM